MQQEQEPSPHTRAKKLLFNAHSLREGPKCVQGGRSSGSKGPEVMQFAGLSVVSVSVSVEPEPCMWSPTEFQFTFTLIFC